MTCALEFQNSNVELIHLSPEHKLNPTNQIIPHHVTLLAQSQIIQAKSKRFGLCSERGLVVFVGWLVEVESKLNEDKLEIQALCNQ